MRPRRPCSAPCGTLSRYLAGCSCFDCCEAYNTYRAEYRAEGMPRMVDVGPARQHLHDLYAAGYTRGAIAAATGVPFGTIRIIDGSSKIYGKTGSRVTAKVRRANADAILSIDAILPGRYGGLIPVEETRRLVKRMAKTMPGRSISRGAGVSSACIRDILTGRTRLIRARTALRILEFAERSGHKRHYETAAFTLVPNAFDRVMESNGWELEAVLDQMGVSRDTYYQIRAGRPVGETKAERMAIACGVRIQTLFDEVA